MGFKEILQRLALMVFSPLIYLISLPLFLGFGFSISTANGLGIFIALLMVYKAVIPWDRGNLTIGDVIDKWKNFGK